MNLHFIFIILKLINEVVVVIILMIQIKNYVLLLKA